MTTPTIFKHPLSPAYIGISLSLNILLFFLVIPLALFSQKVVKEGNYKDAFEDLHCVYTEENGLMHGSYTSFFKNGKKKAEGQFQHNMRIGTWTVYDSTGAVKHQRVYDNPFIFNVLPSKIGLSEAPFKQTTADFENNANGYFIIPVKSEKDIVHSMRYWRMVSDKKQNPALFENNVFFNWITKNVLEEKAKAYITIDKFWNKISAEDLKNRMDTLGTNIVGYYIKEERYFDIKRQFSQSVILALAPMVRVKNTQNQLEEIPLFWVRMPDIRGALVKEKIQTEGLPNHIVNYDDLFFNRYFSSTINPSPNSYNRDINTWLKEDDIDTVRQKMELGMIEVEHNLWGYKR
jgi:hypothetical protein